VNFFGAKDGLVHISQLTQGRPETVGEVVKEGQEVYVKLLGFDDRGKVRLSMKIVDQATGKEIPRTEGEPEEQFSSERPPRRDREGGRGGRDRDRGQRRDRG
jgi:polyribonucleotide nucleotidyltransferase